MSSTTNTEVTAATGPDEPTGAGAAATTPPTPPPAPPALSPVELGRWAWRQLTSMRTALVLLFLLALAAVPGSVIPQSNINAVDVSNWKADHPTLAPIYEKLGLFSVFDSPWFSAIYLLLMISLMGCIVPRLRIYWRNMRARPPRTPRNLSRLPESRTFELDADPADALARTHAVLRRRRYRAELREDSVAGERGYLREAGNLLFHVSVLIVLVGFAYGQLFGYKGGVITVVGQGFSNSLSQYDEFSPGSLFSPGDLPPISLTVKNFHADYLTAGPQAGQPTTFSSKITYTDEPGAPQQHAKLSVNHPLNLHGVNVFLVGHGYAPVVTVKDGKGHIAYKGPVVFLPHNSTFESFGVIKAPDAVPEQLGFEGLFLPTYGFTDARGPFSRFPAALVPVLSLVPYHGDLGMDAGSQNVYELDKTHLKPFASSGPAKLGPTARLKLSPGQTVQLPNGAGSIRFDKVDQWVKLQVSDSPGKDIALIGVLLGILGLLGSLFVRPRRAWARVTRRDGRTVVELAGLDRSSGGGGLADELDELERLVSNHPPAPMQEHK
ncbi:MAG TPA: cytochrome c biogenesis protein ResB [Nocardioidaceae bacterium]|nr:cytochrome c biogenesis protein ResB [Nocardioidaceae bacterium]